MSADAANTILETTVELFKKQGMANVSTRDVTQALGLSRSHLYYYFKDWRSLRIAAFTHFADRELEETTQALQGLNAPKALSALIDYCLPNKEDSSWTLWIDIWDEALRDPSFAAPCMQAMQRWETLLADYIAQGIHSGTYHCKDGAQAARQVFALINGYADQLLLGPSKANRAQIQKEIHHAVDLLLQTKKK